jgi:magnesium transporter
MASTWIDLLDPTPEELRAKAPQHLEETALERLLAPPEHEDEPRPTLQGHGDYVFGVLLIAVAVPEEDSVYYQEVDLVITHDTLLTVRKTPPGGRPACDVTAVEKTSKPDDSAGLLAYRLLDEIAERYLDLVDSLDDEIDELEDKVGGSPPKVVGRRLRELRRDLREIRRTLTPTRDAVHKVLDGRIELDNGDEDRDNPEDLFPRDVEIAFSDAYDKLLRATEALESSRDSLAGVRDFLQGTIANDQNEVVKRLTVIASLLLVPTFIVGLYGQNFRDVPELHWGFGYWWSWGLIILTTVGQLAFFRWKRWI